MSIMNCPTLNSELLSVWLSVDAYVKLRQQAAVECGCEKCSDEFPAPSAVLMILEMMIQKSLVNDELDWNGI